MVTDILLTKGLRYVEAKSFADTILFHTTRITPQITPRGLNPAQVIEDPLKYVDPDMQVWQVSLRIDTHNAPLSLDATTELEGPPSYTQRITLLLDGWNAAPDISRMQRRDLFQEVSRLLPDADEMLNDYLTEHFSVSHDSVTSELMTQLTFNLQQSLERAEN